jgi:hypothetical protein
LNTKDLREHWVPAPLPPVSIGTHIW